jgi:hypothetical protein
MSCNHYTRYDGRRRQAILGTEPLLEYQDRSTRLWGYRQRSTTSSCSPPGR